MPWSSILESTRLRRSSDFAGFCSGSYIEGEAIMPASVAASAGVASLEKRASGSGSSSSATGAGWSTTPESSVAVWSSSPSSPSPK